MDESIEIPQQKPRLGFILSVVAVVFILLTSVLLIYMFSNPSLIEAEEISEALNETASQLGVSADEAMDIMRSMYLIMGGFGIVSALLILLGGILAYYKNMRTAGGILVLLFSILSIFSTGGMVIGMILGIVGGVLILINK